MKLKLITTTLVAVLSLSLSAEMNLGTVDIMLLVKNHPNYDSNKTLLTSTDKDYQKKLEGINKRTNKLLLPE